MNREIGQDRTDSSSTGSCQEEGKHAGEQTGEIKEGKNMSIGLDALLDEQEGYLIYMCACLSAVSKLSIVTATSGVLVMAIE